MKIDEFQQPQGLEVMQGRVERFLQAMDNALKNDLIKLPLKLALETCNKCNTCAEACQIYLTTKDENYLPAKRADLLRRVYKRHFTLIGKLFPRLVGAKELDEDTIDIMAESFYRCTLCRRCSMNCSMGIDNTIITRTGRTILSSIGIEPKFLRKSADTQIKTGNVSGVEDNAFRSLIKFAEEEIEEETGKKIKIPVDKKGAEILFIPPVVDLLVHLEAVTNIAKVFDAVGADWTMSSKCFDSVNFGVFFNDEIMFTILRRQINEAKKIGCKTLVIGECGHAYKAAKMFSETVNGGPLPYEVKHAVEMTAEYIRQGKLKFDPSKNDHLGKVAYHDPCNLARMGGIIEEPRIILKATVNNITELSPNKEMNYCCGGGGGLCLLDELKDFRVNISGKYKVRQIRNSGANVITTACANCKKELNELVEYYKLPVEIKGIHELVGNALIIE